jgi:hypothetical protein
MVCLAHGISQYVPDDTGWTLILFNRLVAEVGGWHAPQRAFWNSPRNATAISRFRLVAVAGQPGLLYHGGTPLRASCSVFRRAVVDVSVIHHGFSAFRARFAHLSTDNAGPVVKIRAVHYEIRAGPADFHAV